MRYVLCVAPDGLSSAVAKSAPVRLVLQHSPNVVATCAGKPSVSVNIDLMLQPFVVSGATTDSIRPARMGETGDGDL